MEEIKINNCPGTLAPGCTTFSNKAIKHLFGGVRVSPVMDFQYDSDSSAPLIARNVGRISLSGAQEKLSAVVRDGRVVLTPDDEQGTHIIKPIPSDKSLRYRTMMPANEHLTMQIAKQVFNIRAAECGLIFFADGEPAYITKRFDIADDGSKIKQEDFSSLLGRTEQTAGANFKYEGSYTDVASKIRELLPAWPVEMAQFFQLVLFNYLFSNGDAHLKNFSVQQTSYGDYILTPAYDLINSRLHIDEDSDFALSEGLLPQSQWSDTYVKTGHPCAEDFRRFGLNIGLAEKITDKIIVQFTMERDAVRELTELSYLDQRMKRMYLRDYHERLSRFRRH